MADDCGNWRGRALPSLAPIKPYHATIFRASQRQVMLRFTTRLCSAAATQDFAMLPALIRDQLTSIVGETRLLPRQR